jgi:Glyoxalase-like domain
MDCADPHALAAFWASMLGGEILLETDSTVIVLTEWTWLSALKVDDYVPPTWPDGEVPKQIHLDLAVDDLDAAAAEAVRLGARLTDAQPGTDRWRVLLDPAGHPFCLTTRVPPEAKPPVSA